MNKAIELQKAKSVFPGEFITEGILRSDIPVTGAVSNLSFKYLASTPNAGATQLTVKERLFRLQLADAFMATGWKLVIYKAPAATPTDAQIATSIDYSYPQPAVFTGSDEAPNFEALYQSQLQVTINKTVYFTQYWTNVFRRVNQAQLGTTTAATFVTGDDAATAYTQASEQMDGKNNGFVPIEQPFYMSGAWDMPFNLTLPTSVNLAGTTSVNYVSLVLAGFVISNGAKYQF
jgi:hypothetical protein